MAGLVPAIHVFLDLQKAWMPVTSTGMTAACKTPAYAGIISAGAQKYGKLP
jgi:hypothetical protein